MHGRKIPSRNPKRHRLNQIDACRHDDPSPLAGRVPKIRSRDPGPEPPAAGSKTSPHHSYPPPFSLATFHLITSPFELVVLVAFPTKPAAR